MRQYDKAVEWARKALRQPHFQWSRHAVLISALGHLGRSDEVHRALDELLRLRPDFTLGFVRKYHLISDPDDMAHYLEGLRKGGVSDLGWSPPFEERQVGGHWSEAHAAPPRGG